MRNVLGLNIRLFDTYLTNFVVMRSSVQQNMETDTKHCLLISLKSQDPFCPGVSKTLRDVSKKIYTKLFILRKKVYNVFV